MNFIVSDDSDSSEGVIVPPEIYIVSDGSDNRCWTYIFWYSHQWEVVNVFVLKIDLILVNIGSVIFSS